MTLREWQELGEERLARHLVFDVVKSRRRSPRTGVEIGFFLVKTPDWVNVVALTHDDHLVLVRQYRAGTRALSLEIPGGLIDRHETDPAQAAARELREETGYVAERMVPIGTMTPNPAIFTNRCHTFLATGCSRAGELQMDSGEDIVVELVHRSQLDEMVRQGTVDHALVLAAFAFWRAHEAREGS